MFNEDVADIVYDYLIYSGKSRALVITDLGEDGKYCDLINEFIEHYDAAFGDMVDLENEEVLDNKRDELDNMFAMWLYSNNY